MGLGIPTRYLKNTLGLKPWNWGLLVRGLTVCGQIDGASIHMGILPSFDQLYVRTRIEFEGVILNNQGFV